jgi:hypothetical protein
MASTSILRLPTDSLILLPDYVHNIEDCTNLSSTCTKLRDCVATASPKTILRLAAAQSSIFFRPSPHFLVTATAGELGHWSRESKANEKGFASDYRRAYMYPSSSRWSTADARGSYGLPGA